jgi:hypothetical protein
MLAQTIFAITNIAGASHIILKGPCAGQANPDRSHELHKKICHELHKLHEYKSATNYPNYTK